ncbi:MAG: hypothetical protein HXY25_07280 [Alphaproteobacteria bacterium]|nr:hypothetical protein [Alphaproteobacteria bacterium]
MSEPAPRAAPASRTSFAFDRKEGETLVMGGTALAIIAAFIFLLTGHVAVAVFGVASALVALHYRPMIDQKKPQVATFEDGLFVDGLGLLPWQDIAQARVVHSWLRAIRMTECRIETRRPVRDVVRPQTNGLFRMLQTRIWTQPAPDRLTLKLTAVKGAADGLEDALRARLPGSG